MSWHPPADFNWKAIGEENERLKQRIAELEREYRYAMTSLARSLKHVHPNIEPLDSLSGLCDQVDNGLAVYAAALTAALKTAREIIDRIRQEAEELKVYSIKADHVLATNTFNYGERIAIECRDALQAIDKADGNG